MSRLPRSRARRRSLSCRSVLQPLDSRTAWHLCVSCRAVHPPFSSSLIASDGNGSRRSSLIGSTYREGAHSVGPWYVFTRLFERVPLNICADILLSEPVLLAFRSDWNVCDSSCSKVSSYLFCSAVALDVTTYDIAFLCIAYSHPPRTAKSTARRCILTIR